MDKIIALYTTTEGRVGRQQFWIGALILVAINIVISLLIFPLIGLGMPNIALLTTTSDSVAISAALEAAIRTSAWASLVLYVIMAYPYYALSIKRRHDKDNAGLDVLIYLGLTFVMLLLQALGLGMTMTDMGGIMVPTPSMLLSIIGIVLGLYGLYLLVVLGFLKGTTGPNQFGPDPLGGA